MYVLDFSPPMNNLQGCFNTIRLGIKWASRLNPGDTVLLIDKPHSILIGPAIVESVVLGKLGEVASLHASRNHNQKGLDIEGAPQRLIENMKKRYGPMLINENKRCTVIYLRTEI